MTVNTVITLRLRIETELMVSQFEKEGYLAVLIDAPVLFESGFDKMCDVTLCVTAPMEEKLARIMKRDGIFHVILSYFSPTMIRVLFLCLFPLSYCSMLIKIRKKGKNKSTSSSWNSLLASCLIGV